MKLWTRIDTYGMIQFVGGMIIGKVFDETVQWYWFVLAVFTISIITKIALGGKYK